MLMLLSPSKTLDYETPATTESFSTPEFLQKSSELVKVMKEKSFLDLMELMEVSQKISELNVERFNQWKLPFSTKNAKQAVLAFKGDVYTGLDASALSENRLTYTQSHLRILSGLYG